MTEVGIGATPSYKGIYILASCPGAGGAFLWVKKHLFKVHSTLLPTHKSLSTSDLMYFLDAQLGPTELINRHK